MFCSPEIRRPKAETREWPDSIGCCSAGVAINSDFGLRVSFDLRSSGLGFGMARTDFSAALLQTAASGIFLGKAKREQRRS
jgi:hypothetical protein